MKPPVIMVKKRIKTAIPIVVLLMRTIETSLENQLFYRTNLSLLKEKVVPFNHHMQLQKISVKDSTETKIHLIN